MDPSLFFNGLLIFWIDFQLFCESI